MSLAANWLTCKGAGQAETLWMNQGLRKARWEDRMPQRKVLEKARGEEVLWNRKEASGQELVRKAEVHIITSSDRSGCRPLADL